jgi:hypothetical protein
MSKRDYIRTDYYVYEHWRPDIDKCFYVGKGRKKRAWKLCERNLHHTAVCSKLISLGMCVDVRIVVTNLSEDTAYRVECERIDFYGIENLTNKTAGGAGLPNPKDEVRRKMGISKIGNKNMVGRKLSDETKRKISAAHKGKEPNWDLINRLSEINKGNQYGLGKKPSSETRAKMSAAHTGNTYALGYKWSKEKRDEMSRQRKGHGPNKACNDKMLALCRKPVLCITDGKTFESAMQAGKHYGLFNHVKVAEVCRGVRKTAAGRIFKYIEKQVA